jgi:hypothetical protein
MPHPLTIPEIDYKGHIQKGCTLIADAFTSLFFWIPGLDCSGLCLGGLRPHDYHQQIVDTLARNLNLVAVRETNQCTPSKFAGALVPDSRVGRFEHSLCSGR